MNGFRVILSLGLAVFLTSCSMFDSAAPVPPNPFTVSSRPETALTRSLSAVHSGRILIGDRNGYRNVFGSDNFRFRQQNLRPLSISILPYNGGYSCTFLVTDSLQEDGVCNVVTISGENNSDSAPVVSYAGSPAEKRIAPAERTAALPEPAVIAAVRDAMRRRIESGEISWVQDGAEGIAAAVPGGKDGNTSLKIIPDDLWERDRLNAVNRTLRLSMRDLALCEVSALPDHRIALTYAVIPLIERVSENSVTLPRLTIPADYNGNISGKITCHGDNRYLDVSTVLVNPFPQTESEDIYETAFRYVLERKLVPADLAAKEKIRFFLPPSAVSADFPSRFRNDAIPARNPSVRDWSLKLPYQERVGYTSLDDGAFYYSAGPIRIVNDSCVYVKIHLRSRHPVENREIRMNWYLKLKKGLFGWTVVGNE